MIVQVLAGRGNALLNHVIQLAVGKLHGHAHRVLDRVRVRRTVADDAHALQSQQRRAAVLGVVEALLEIGKGLAL